MACWKARRNKRSRPTLSVPEYACSYQNHRKRSIDSSHANHLTKLLDTVPNHQVMNRTKRSVLTSRFSTIRQNLVGQQNVSRRTKEENGSALFTNGPQVINVF
jgi:hypothetical protein